MFNTTAAAAARPYSDATAEKMDLEARQMVDDAYKRTLDLVREKKEQVCNAWAKGT